MRRQLLLASLVGLAGMSALTIINCSAKEDESVQIDTKCDVSRLSASNPGEATVLAYVNAANAFQQKAAALESKLKDECNAINADLGIAAGTDIRTACNPIATRIANANKESPTPDGGVAALWVVVEFAEACGQDPTAEAKCIDTCSGKPPCDMAQACPTGKQLGTCSGTCTGSCIGAQSTTPGACTGSCEGTVARNPAASPEAGATPPCDGVCEGLCPTPTYLGRCEAGCRTGFRGQCLGTCNGTCDGNPVGAQPMDAGADTGVDSGGDADPDAGDAMVDAGPIDSGGPGPIPGGMDGNCKGLCIGSCSGKASGSCAAACAGATFSAGGCVPCVGQCTYTAQAAVDPITTCTGTCTSSAATCAGTCSGACDVPMTNVACTVTPNCDADDICKKSCRLVEAMAAKCATPTGIHLRVPGDYVLYDVLKKHGPELVQTLKEVLAMRSAVQDLTDTTQGAFQPLGVRRDAAFLCIQEAGTNFATGLTSYNNATGVTRVIKGVQF